MNLPQASLPQGNTPGIPFEPSNRYPEPRVELLHPSFAATRIYSATVEQLATGCRWSEGPQWFGDGRFLLWSDIPNNRMLRWDEGSGQVSVFRSPSNFSNGLARDAQGRLLACEHGGRRVTRTELDGAITVLADAFDGKRLNSPNDIVCRRRDGSIWFTDPSFGIHGHWEGEPAPQERPHAVYRLNADGSGLQPVIEDLNGPNGLAFSPDESVLYVVESRAAPTRRIWAYDCDAQGRLSGKRVHIQAAGAEAYDGIAVDTEGRIWAGLGSDGRAGVPAEGLDGVRVYGLDGAPIGHIHLPERCANLCFGGRHRNRVFMAASHSLYALSVNTQGASPL